MTFSDKIINLARDFIVLFYFNNKPVVRSVTSRRDCGGAGWTVAESVKMDNPAADCVQLCAEPPPKKPKQQTLLAYLKPKEQCDTPSPIIPSPPKSVGNSPWWNESVREASAKTWLPKNTDEESSLTDSFAHSLSTKSWFSAKKKGGCAPPVAEHFKPKEARRETMTRTRKIKLRLTQSQRALLRRWFGAARWTYNKCVESVQVKKEVEKVTKSALRALWVRSDALKNTGNEWAESIPYEVRSASVVDFVNARAVEYSKKRKAADAGGIHTKAKYKFRSVKDPSEAIYIGSRCYKNGIIYPTFWKAEDGTKLGKLRGFSERLPVKLNHDAKLVRNNRNEYYLCVCIDVEKKPTKADNNQVSPKFVASLDPGVRAFQTVYDAKRQCTLSVGGADISRVIRIAKCADKLQSKWSQDGVKSRQRYKMKRAAKRIHKRVQNLTGEVHRKLARFLCTQYDEVLIPEFGVQKMTSKMERKIGSKSVRQMISWSHYAFRQRLLHKAEELGVIVHVVNEAFTSKTCGSCGKLNAKLGSSKHFHCPSCHYEADRDENGARNILLRNFNLVSRHF